MHTIKHYYIYKNRNALLKLLLYRELVTTLSPKFINRETLTLDMKLYSTHSQLVIYLQKHIMWSYSVYPDVCERLALLTWTYSFRFRWSWAIFRSSGHSVTSNRGTWRQPPDTNAVVLDISHLHLWWFVNFYKQKPRETNEVPAPKDKTRLVFVSSSGTDRIISYYY